MRPTKGEMSVTPASAHAAACAKEKSSVMLQWMPSRSSFAAARMPSQVLASLIRIFSRPTPRRSYMPISRFALSTEACMSNESRASTSVETRPATCFRISRPTRTKRPSIAAAVSPRASRIAASTRWRKRGSCAEVRSSEGLVVASCGFQRATASMSPVSATTSECFFRDSSWEVMRGIFSQRLTFASRMGVREHLRCRMPSTGGHPMARIHYAIRAGAFAYSFLVLAIHGAERGFGAWYWLALVVQFLVYPHLAYLHARRAVEPRRAERINLYLDATLLGAWIGVLHFPLWIAYAALFSTSLNAIVVFGAVRGAWVIAAFAAGAAVGMALRGVEFLEETSPLVTMLCFVGSHAYSGAVGAVVYALRERVRDSEARYRLLAENAADLI